MRWVGAPSSPGPPTWTRASVDSAQHERAEVIARDLKLEAARGRYDRFQAPLDLARALAERLKPLDNHFMVAWSPPLAAVDAKSAPRASVVEDNDRERRSNYGLRAIEILPGSIGRIDLRHFAEFATPSDPALEKANAAMALLAGPDAIVIDLRNNGGAKGVETRNSAVRRKFERALGDLPITLENGRGDAPGLGKACHELRVVADVENAHHTGVCLPKAGPQGQGRGRRGAIEIEDESVFGGGLRL
jgi:hypothetical protein